MLIQEVDNRPEFKVEDISTINLCHELQSLLDKKLNSNEIIEYFNNNPETYKNYLRLVIELLKIVQNRGQYPAKIFDDNLYKIIFTLTLKIPGNVYTKLRHYLNKYCLMYQFEGIVKDNFNEINLDQIKTLAEASYNFNIWHYKQSNNQEIKNYLREKFKDLLNFLIEINNNEEALELIKKKFIGGRNLLINFTIQKKRPFKNILSVITNNHNLTLEQKDEAILILLKNGLDINLFFYYDKNEKNDIGEENSQRIELTLLRYAIEENRDELLEELIRYYPTDYKSIYEINSEKYINIDTLQLSFVLKNFEAFKILLYYKFSSIDSLKKFKLEHTLDFEHPFFTLMGYDLKLAYQIFDLGCLDLESYAKDLVCELYLLQKKFLENIYKLKYGCDQSNLIATKDDVENVAKDGVEIVFIKNNNEEMLIGIADAEGNYKVYNSDEKKEYLEKLEHDYEIFKRMFFKLSRLNYFNCNGNVYRDSLSIIAVQNNDIGLLEKALQMGFSLNDTDKLYGRNCLMLACENNNINLVLYIINKNIVNVNTTSSLGVTALMFAASKGNLEMVKFLVQRGADISIVHFNNGMECYMSAIDYARGYGYLEVESYLINEQRNQIDQSNYSMNYQGL